MSISAFDHALDAKTLQRTRGAQCRTARAPLYRGYSDRVSERDGIEALTEAIGRYNEAWNKQDLEAIVAMHAPDMVFANHTAGESASGAEVRGHIAKIFESWPEMKFETRRLYVREGVVTQEWTATATHSETLRRGELEAPPSGRSVSWDGVDVIPFEDGLIKRKDVYSDSVGILRQVGLLD
jgi:steroid delta-isomerase-like uncharacterized protein